MKKNDLLQIIGLDLRQLRLKVKSLKDEIAGLVLDKNMKKLKDVKIISQKRKDTAQILTILNQKQLLARLEPQEEGVKK
ncbi:MAG: 50S ribosomal protein L29 [Patescibacteria group bacterium]